MKDLEKAREIYEEAQRYYLGNGVEKDQKKAMSLFLEAADLGSVEAMYYAGVCWFHGRGIYMNHYEAVYWFKKAAKLGDPKAQFALFTCFHHGYGVSEDEKKAHYWLCKAAGNGHPEANTFLKKQAEKEKLRSMEFDEESNELRKLYAQPRKNTLDIRKTKAPYLVLDLKTYELREEEKGPAEDPEILQDDNCRVRELWLRRIESGVFVMGSPNDEPGHKANETQHEVLLTEPYYIGVFPITKGQYEAIQGNYAFNDEDKNELEKDGTLKLYGHPVQNISYDMIRGISKGAKWPLNHDVDRRSLLGLLRQNSGLMFDIPTEAQWEFACRAGTVTALNSRKDLLLHPADSWRAMNEVGNFYDNDTGDTDTERVGEHRPNGWGLYDMHGNVWEWCLDWADSFKGVPETDPKGADINDSRILRGGSFMSPAIGCRSACRNSDRSDHNKKNYGFRVVLLPNPPEEKREKKVVKPLKDIETTKAKYLVIDLLTYEIREEENGPMEDPAIAKDNAWLTHELWFRRIEPGKPYVKVFTDEPITKPFYIGVNKVTQEQYELITGTNPSFFKGDIRPVESVSYDMLRGSKKGACWPFENDVDEHSLIGWLRDKTALMFDLPSEAQWEYACWSDGRTFFPNSWGLYGVVNERPWRPPSDPNVLDFHIEKPDPYYAVGTLEWCLDAADKELLINRIRSSHTYRIMRAVCLSFDGYSNVLDTFPSNETDHRFGFRLAINLLIMV